MPHLGQRKKPLSIQSENGNSDRQYWSGQDIVHKLSLVTISGLCDSVFICYPWSLALFRTQGDCG